MCMQEKTLIKKCEEMKELEKQVDRLNYRIDELKNELKKDMVERKVNELRVGDFKISYKEVTSTRFDQKRFKEDHEQLYESYKTQVSSYSKLTVK